MIKCCNYRKFFWEEWIWVKVNVFLLLLKFFVLDDGFFFFFSNSLKGIIKLWRNCVIWVLGKLVIVFFNYLSK